MSDLVEFLKARLAEDERIARKAAEGPWTAENIVYGEGFANDDYEVHSLARIVVSHVSYEGGGACEADAEHIAHHDPARVLREVEATRRIVALHEPVVIRAGGGAAYFDTTTVCRSCEPPKMFPETAYPCDTIRLLALPYADHPDYREEWRP